jgi:hypothetical protein
MTITIYIGDVTEDLASVAKEQDPSAFLIDSSNYQTFINTEFDCNVVAFTSLGDLPKNLKIFFDICGKADKLIYSPPKSWSDGKRLNLLNPVDSMQGLTEYCLLTLCDTVPVSNIKLALHKKNPAELLAERKGQHKQIWFVGPSTVDGSGIDPNLRFGQIVADHLNLPASFLTKDATSNLYNADQILRSDIRSGDIVAWGLWNPFRLPLVYRGRLYHLQPSLYEDHAFLNKIFPAHILHSENLFYSNVNAVEQVINFCSKIGAKLIMFCALDLLHPSFLRYLRTKPNYAHYPIEIEFLDDSKILPKYLDHSSDNKHAGIQQHRHFADFLLKHINDSV